MAEPRSQTGAVPADGRPGRRELRERATFLSVAAGKWGQSGVAMQAEAVTVETIKNITLGQRETGDVHSGSVPSTLQQD